MSAVIARFENDELVINLDSLLKGITYEEYLQLCRDNPDLRIERTSKGEIIITPPTGGVIGGRNFDLTVEFGLWVKKRWHGQRFRLLDGIRVAQWRETIAGSFVGQARAMECFDS